KAGNTAYSKFQNPDNFNWPIVVKVEVEKSTTEPKVYVTYVENHTALQFLDFPKWIHAIIDEESYNNGTPTISLEYEKK
ncbi:hypothetical protein GGH92_007624, partial [Coemansia sp. RSA 2673]